MAGTPPLSLSNLVNISVTVAPSAATANPFNQGLFVGPTASSINGRISQYTSAASLLSAGYTVNSPEYLAAQIYFSQTPAPSFMWIGQQYGTALGTVVVDGRTVSDGVMSSVTTPTHLSSATAAFVAGDVGSAIRVVGAGAAGADLVSTISTYTNATNVVLADACLTTVAAAQTSIGFVGHGFKANDVVSVTQAGGANGFATVLTVGTAGQALTMGVVAGTQGTGYSVANGLTATAVSPSTGVGLEVNVTAVGESLLQAATACRAANSTWYGLAVNNPVDADNLALAAWADALWQTTRYYVWSNDATIPAGSANNLAIQLQTLKMRVMCIYATTQSGLYPNNIYAAAGLMGVEMGLNTGLANSFFTLAHKIIQGIAPEPLTQTQYTTIINQGFNVYGFFGGQYQLVEAGFMSNGAPSYLWINLAMLVANLQVNILNILSSNPAVPQTNAGEQLLIGGANQACANAANIGFLASSIWRSATVLNLSNGDAVVGGFLNQAQPYSLQSSGDRAAGKAMPIYCCITTAGAVQSLIIGVYTQL